MTDVNNADNGNKESAPKFALLGDITVIGKHDSVVLPLKVNGVDLPDEVPGLSSFYRLECGGVGTLSWAKPRKRPVKYIVERSVDNQATWIKHTEVNGNFQKADIEVTPGVTNFFRIIAWTSDTKKSTGSVISIFREAPLPAPILNRVYVSLRKEPTARPQIYFDWLWPSFDNPQAANLVPKYFIQTLSANSLAELTLQATDNNNWNLGVAARADIGGWSDVLKNKEPYNPSKIDYHAYRFPKYNKRVGDTGVVQTSPNNIPYSTLSPSQAPAGKITAIRVAQVSENNGCVGVFSNYLTVITPNSPICGQSVLIGDATAGCCEAGGRSGSDTSVTDIYEPYGYLGCKPLCGCRSLQEDTLNVQRAINGMAFETMRQPMLTPPADIVDPRRAMRYVFNDSYNFIHLSSLYTYFNGIVLDRSNQGLDAYSTPFSSKDVCGAFVCFKDVPTQVENAYTGKNIYNVLYAEPLLFLPKNYKFLFKQALPIKMPINFTLLAVTDLKYAKDPARGGAPTPEIPFKVTLKIVSESLGVAVPLKFYKEPGPKVPANLGNPVMYNKTRSGASPSCAPNAREFNNVFVNAGTSLVLYEDSFPSADYIAGYDALGNPIAVVEAVIEANVDTSNVDNNGPCGIWLKCVGFDMQGDCNGTFAEVDGTIEAPQLTPLIIMPDPFPELGPRYLIVEYKPQGASTVTGYDGDGITWQKTTPSVPRLGPILVAPDSPGDIGALAIWVGGRVIRRMGNAEGTELRVVIPITTQTGIIALNYVDLPGTYGDNAGKWHFDVYFGRDCFRAPLRAFPTPPPQPPT
jgi:hypothetical protein